MDLISLIKVLFLKLLDYIDGNKNLQKEDRFNGFIIPVSEFDGVYKDLYIVLASMTKTKKAMCVSIKDHENKKVIVLHVLKDDYNTDGMYDNLLKIEDQFAHEFIHYRDLKNRKSGNLNTAQIKNEKGRAVYYNTPEEFNAYYYEGLYSYYNHKKSIPHSFEEFKTNILNNLNKRFLRNLNEDNKKRLENRIIKEWEDNYKYLIT